MIKQLEQVKEFHDKFEIYYNEIPSIPPTAMETLRVKLLGEEFLEVMDEINNEDFNMSRLSKELADLIYIIYGTVLTYGLQDKFEEIFDEVHRSNMSKLTVDGKVLRREDGKVLKSSLYSPADISSILND